MQLLILCGNNGKERTGSRRLQRLAEKRFQKVAVYQTTIYPMEGDLFGTLAPSGVLRYALDSAVRDMRQNKVDAETIYPLKGIVWMISRMRFFQYRPIKLWDSLSFHTFPRVIERDRYILYMEACQGEEMAIRFDTVLIPVYARERKIAPLEAVEPLWQTPPREAVSRELFRLEMPGDFTQGSSRRVRKSECDENGHLNSARYLDYVCDELGYWNGEAPLMRFMQVDYAHEIYPDTVIRFETARRDGKIFLRAHKEDGQLAFCAACTF